MLHVPICSSCFVQYLYAMVCDVPVCRSCSLDLAGYFL